MNSVEALSFIILISAFMLLMWRITRLKIYVADLEYRLNYAFYLIALYKKMQEDQAE